MHQVGSSRRAHFLPFSLSSIYLALQNGEGLTTNPLPPPTASVLLSNADLKKTGLGWEGQSVEKKARLGAKGQP